MATTLSSSIAVNVIANHQQPLSLVTYIGNLNQTFNGSFANADADKLYHTRETALASPFSYSPFSGLSSSYGTSQIFNNVKYIYVKNTHASADLSIGGGSTPILANAVTITAGGCLSIVATYTVGSGNRFILFSSSSAMAFDFILIGN